MDKYLKKKWVDALRSEKYSEGFGILRNVDYGGNISYCALGVLADVIDPTWVFDESCGSWMWSESLSDSLLCTVDVAIDEDYENAEGLYLDLETQFEIASLQTNDEKCFSEIADWIETNIP